MRHRIGTAIPLMSTQHLSRTEWLEARRRIIGSSDAPIIAGVNPYKTPLALWNEKVGLVPVDETDPSEASHWGNVLEAVVAKEWAKQTGYKIRRAHAILVNDQDPWQGANLDFLATTPDGPVILEVKTTAEHNRFRYMDGVPDDHYLQIQHQLMVTNLERAIHVILIGGQHLQWSWVDRDRIIQHDLRALEREFFQRVIDRTPPMDEAMNPQDILIAQGDRTDETVIFDETAARHFQQYAAWSHIKDEAERERDVHKAALLKIMGSHKRGRWMDDDGHWWSITVAQQQRKRIDKDILDQRYPGWRDQAEMIQVIPQVTIRPPKDSKNDTTNRAAFAPTKQEEVPS